MMLLCCECIEGKLGGWCDVSLLQRYQRLSGLISEMKTQSSLLYITVSLGSHGGGVGEWNEIASFDDRPTRVGRDVSGASSNDEDPRNRPKGLENASEHVSERLEQRSQEDSPRRAQNEPDDLEVDADVSAVPSSIGDPSNRPKNLQNGLEQVPTTVRAIT